MIRPEIIIMQINNNFDTYIYNGYNQCSHTSLHYAQAMFNLAQKIEHMLDEFDIKDWQFELKHLQDYLEVHHG
ncbi:hypothetical protein LCGC14_0548940 [marine sediment metagenome]|uniref:Uncharacterized protein n=1 Tax=marine sediment metagenome TaxID=412755 RepID=A0A0F9RVH3_9ZZZZ